tara:strand:+ start:1251 stop:1868 length:618 start_codon:yes stop_codon:yes gene_type:complete
MADLIIKPQNISGDKVIIQDQAGGAVLTTADSGATIANSTLTTPTIASMANCTFPAGHVIQTVTRSYSTAHGDGMTGQTLIKALSNAAAQYYCTINNVLADSKVLITFHWHQFTYCSAIEVGHGYGVYRGNDIIFQTSSYGYYDRQNGVSGTHELATMQSINFLDTSPATGTNTYHLGIKSQHTSYTTYVSSGVTPFHAILQEVA